MSGFAPLPRLSPGNLTTVCLGVIAQHFACNSFMGTVGCDVKGIDPMGRCQIDNTSMARNIGCPVLTKHVCLLVNPITLYNSWVGQPALQCTKQKRRVHPWRRKISGLWDLPSRAKSFLSVPKKRWKVQKIWLCIANFQMIYNDP